MKMISIVTPCFNEADNVDNFYKTCCEVLERVCPFEILFVDDGSRDGTLQQLKILATKDSRVKYISLSRNSGHQNALKAGLDYAKGDCVVTIDADGQQPIDLVPEMMNLWANGYQVVYTLREDDQKISFFKKVTSRLFYKINSLLTDVKVENGAADFRLLDRKVVDALRTLPENDLFWRGLVAWVGFKQVALPYRARPRQLGTSKYTLKKMLNLALSGMTSFSTRPLRLSLLIGLFMLGLGLCYAVYILIMAFWGKTVSGWPSLALLIIFFGSLQFLFLGILGEYVGKIFIENKKRPCYFINSTNVTEGNDDP